jgi:pterin-4a-carbinolamine dehydratase
MGTPRVSNLLREYFEHEVPSQHLPRDFRMDTRSLPIAPRSDGRWHVNQSPERLCRTYEFGDRRAARDFINELMDYEDGVNHHGDIRCKGPVVTIEVYTHGVECVTEVDKEYANEAELIYNDVCSYGYR